ncbi:MAG: hypothetical protein H0W71_01610 [Sphingomonas sp.]|nr:hypothetical protein [Sphingomonas sp.]
MRKSVLGIVGMIAAVSLMGSSTAAVAATSRAPAQVNSWQALAVLNGGASAIAYCGAAVAAQAGTGCVFPQVDAPQPLPAPLPGAVAGGRINPLFIVLGLLGAGLLAYLLLHNGHHRNNGNSPT